MRKSHCPFCGQGKCLRLCKDPGSAEAQSKLRGNIRKSLAELSESTRQGQKAPRQMAKLIKKDIKRLNPEKRRKMKKKLKKIMHK